MLAAFGVTIYGPDSFFEQADVAHRIFLASLAIDTVSVFAQVAYKAPPNRHALIFPGSDARMPATIGRYRGDDSKRILTAAIAAIEMRQSVPFAAAFRNITMLSERDPFATALAGTRSAVVIEHRDAPAITMTRAAPKEVVNIVIRHGDEIVVGPRPPGIHEVISTPTAALPKGSLQLFVPGHDGDLMEQDLDVPPVSLQSSNQDPVLFLAREALEKVW